MFVDTWNAPPDAVGATWLRLAADLKAAAVVLSANSKVSCCAGRCNTSCTQPVLPHLQLEDAPHVKITISDKIQSGLI